MQHLERSASPQLEPLVQIYLPLSERLPLISADSSNGRQGLPALSKWEVSHGLITF